jgi:hypothetical protein
MSLETHTGELGVADTPLPPQGLRKNGMVHTAGSMVNGLKLIQDLDRQELAHSP